jgi:hypothetical protein
MWPLYAKKFSDESPALPVHPLFSEAVLRLQVHGRTHYELVLAHPSIRTGRMVRFLRLPCLRAGELIRRVHPRDSQESESVSDFRSPASRVEFLLCGIAVIMSLSFRSLVLRSSLRSGVGRANRGVFEHGYY